MRSLHHRERSTLRNSQVKQRDQRELTYESERSSIFNEKVISDKNDKDQSKFQYSRGIEESKKSAPINLSQIQSNEKRGIQIVNDKDGKAGKIQQLLELNLRMQNLTQLTDQMFAKSQFLRSVDLRNNNIKELPDSICNLNILWKLRLDSNLLTSLPKAIGKLERLEVLTASGNKLKRLPSSLFNLKSKLTMLQLNDNRLKRLSNAIGSMTKLKALLLHNNKLARLPSEIGNL